jgi:hypothetical protein
LVFLSAYSLIGSSPSLIAQEEGMGASIFLDADRQGYNLKEEIQVFTGDVVAIGAGTLIAADKVQLDRKAGVLNAQGHVVVMSRNQVFMGQSIRYFMDTADFRINDAVMVANDQKKAKEIVDRLLGFTLTEQIFEAEKGDRLKEFGSKKRQMQEEARVQVREIGDVSEDLVERYALTLEQEDLAKNQDSPALSRMVKDKRERYERRRTFWDQARKVGSEIGVSSTMRKAYFRMSGDYIERTKGNDFIAQNALWTPCKCDENEAPAWGFNADRAEAQIGGYADLYHPVLEIKGIPVLYLPYLKLPVKDQRQSGFLMPLFSFEDRSGNIYSQPAYFALDENTDATVTTDVFEKRGTRLGVEYRYQQREFSGWELNLEGIRDRVWMEDRGLREDMKSLYKNGLASSNKKVEEIYRANRTPIPEGSPGASPNATTDRAYLESILSDPNYWIENYGLDRPNTRGNEGWDPESLDAVNRSIENDLAIPGNAWRSRYAWRGVTFFAPRLSFVSSGDIASDHRYIEELYLPNDFQEAIFNSKDARTYSQASGMVHLDGKDFYMGLGGLRGDNYLLDVPFEGQQLPMRLKFQSRAINLLPESSPIELQTQFKSEALRISQTENETIEVDETATTLSDGSWRRLRAETISPLYRGLFTVNHFADGESRYIEHSGLPDSRSEIRSWRTGLALNLPIDGKGELGESFQDEDRDPNDPYASTNMVHHLMNWGLEFSTRPVVVRNGVYGEKDPETGNDLRYFASDGELEGKARRTINDEDRMALHKRITFQTSHSWRLLRRSWKFIPGANASTEEVQETEKVQETFLERARRELKYSLDQPLTGEDQIFDPEQGDLLLNRYQLVDNNYATPVSFNAKISYDFIDAEKREEERQINSELDQAISVKGAQRDLLVNELEELQAALDAINERGDDADQDQREALVAQIATKEREISSVDQERKGIASEKKELAEPWLGPIYSLNIRHAGYTLTNTGEYTVYQQTFRKLNFDLSLPTFFKTSLSVGYQIEREFVEDNLEGDTEIRETRYRKLDVRTGLIPGITSFISVRRKNAEGETFDYTQHYRVSIGASYLSSSDCWGMNFSRLKDYGKDEGNATYVLRLSVLFLGQPREIPGNLSSPAVREYQTRKEES